MPYIITTTQLSSSHPISVGITTDRTAVATLDEALDDVRAAYAEAERVRSEARRAREHLCDEVVAARAAGYTLAQIGTALGLTRQRVMQLSKH